MEFTLKKRLEQFQETIRSTIVTNAENSEFSLEEAAVKIHEILMDAKNKKRDLYLIGNGGSAAIASHAAIDLMNVGKISAHTLHDSSALTCMANDYGYENAFSNIVELTLKTTDVLIAISSSGISKNIINAVESARMIGSTVITLSGFDSNNNLREMGDINFWCNSRDYGLVEITHQFILHNISDRFISSNS